MLGGHLPALLHRLLPTVSCTDFVVLLSDGVGGLCVSPVPDLSDYVKLKNHIDATAATYAPYDVCERHQVCGDL